VDAARGIEAQIEDAVERAVARLLKPYLRRICEPEPATYTASQAATVLQVSEDTIGRMVRRGVLARVPYVDGKLLIPRRAVDALAAGETTRTSLGRSARSA
jgi:excisionase family DNA binding protein